MRLFGKLEASTPVAPVKRIGLAMIEAAEREGRIEPGRTTIVEATSGNTGIALAFVCAARGYDLVLSLPQGMSRERETLLRLYGARFQITESLGGMNEAVDAARALADRDYMFLPDQFSNPANPAAHRDHTGPEVLRQLDGDVDVLVAGVGTGGTITGVGEVLKAANPQCRVVAVEPATSAVLSGRAPGPHRIQGIGAAVLLSEIIDVVIFDSIDTALSGARGRARGPQRGVALSGALQVRGRSPGPADRRSLPTRARTPARRSSLARLPA